MDTLVAILALTVLLASVLGGAVVWMRRADAAWRGLMRSIESRNSLVTEYAVGQRDGGHHPR